MNRFKPMLAPNNSTDGTKIDWHSRIQFPANWYVSEKLDGIRCEIFFSKDGLVRIRTRALKPFKCKWIHDLQESLRNRYFHDIVLEGEIFADGLSRNELLHVIASKDITNKPTKRKYYNLWKKSNQGRKLNANGRYIWPFPNKDYMWSITVPNNLKINLFDVYYGNDAKFEQRLSFLNKVFNKLNLYNDSFKLIKQYKFDDLDSIENWYNEIVDIGGEGLILKHKSNRYKFNRVTLNQCQLFKMKDEFNYYAGTILDVVEGTKVIAGLDTTVNELGRSVTSKLKQDREPSGKAKGLLVRTKFGKLTLTLKGFNNTEKQHMLENKDLWINKIINFIAMKPNKINGVPLQAKYIKEKQKELT